MEHKCKTSNQVEIVIGLRVRDYDGQITTVIGEPSKWDLEDDTCWPCVGHHGHWWKTENGGIFDGSRLVAI